MREIVVETARLKLVPLSMAWNDAQLALFHEPEVSDWLFLTGPPTREQLEARTRAHEALWRERGIGLFAVLEKSSGRFVGRVGAMETIGNGRIEIAWSTTRAVWGLGYASEAAIASIAFTFERSELDCLDCYLRPDNHASRRVAEKAGFLYRDTRYLYDRVLRYYQLPRVNAQNL